eukprot:6290685-Heterocapsa_arctica.AAC.1
MCWTMCFKAHQIIHDLTVCASMSTIFELTRVSGSTCDEHARYKLASHSHHMPLRPVERDAALCGIRPQGFVEEPALVGHRRNVAVPLKTGSSSPSKCI